VFAPVLPPEATAAVLLFVLVVLLNHAAAARQEVAGTAQRELDRAQKLMAVIQQEARQGNRAALAKFVEEKSGRNLNSNPRSSDL